MGLSRRVVRRRGRVGLAQLSACAAHERPRGPGAARSGIRRCRSPLRWDCGDERGDRWRSRRRQHAGDTATRQDTATSDHDHDQRDHVPEADPNDVPAQSGAPSSACCSSGPRRAGPVGTYAIAGDRPDADDSHQRQQRRTTRGRAIAGSRIERVDEQPGRARRRISGQNREGGQCHQQSHERQSDEKRPSNSEKNTRPSLALRPRPTGNAATAPEKCDDAQRASPSQPRRPPPPGLSGAPTNAWPLPGRAS